jgi:hypothetical protein
MPRIRLIGREGTVIDGVDRFPGDVVEVSAAVGRAFVDGYKQAEWVEDDEVPPPTRGMTVNPDPVPEHADPVPVRRASKKGKR